MCNEHGPLLSDAEFFGSCILSDALLTEAISKSSECADYHLCREIFAERVRSTLMPERYLSCLPRKKEITRESILERAELAMRHVMTACHIPHDFGVGPVDWFSNPTYNGYKEWTWQLSRHEELLSLARAYRETKDERYAEECCALFDSWVKQATRYSVNGNNSEALCWRSIECGIRMSLVWPEVIHSIIGSSACNDDFLTDFYKSVYEHAALLRRFHKTKGNWLIMEMSGLLHIAVLCPWFAERDEWFEYAKKKLAEELGRQVYPDGFQIELSTGYQQVLVIHYARAIRLLCAYGERVPSEFESVLRNMLGIYVKMMRPGNVLPDVNDGSLARVRDQIEPYFDLVADDPTLKWVVTDGKEGTPPKETAFALPYAGIATFRTGWGDDDTWLLFDGGPFGAGHQHEDKLNLLLHTRGKYVLAEGNNYAYDDSEMRKYVLSTRAHNTVMVDGMEQNRRSSYKWYDEMIGQKSGLAARLSDYADACRAVYDEGYGANADKSVRQERSVYLVKKADLLSPFVLVVDRLFSDSCEHTYEIQYHLDTDGVRTEGLNAVAKPLRIYGSSDFEELARMTVEYGTSEPRLNGWTANSAIQGDYRPIYVLKYILRGESLRWVTLLLPMDGDDDVIGAVRAGTRIEDKEIVIVLKDGRRLIIDESEML